MALFKAVKKPVLRQSASDGTKSSSLRPQYAPKAPPCNLACPIGTDVRAWIATIADGDVESRSLDQSLETAWKKITARNPFPAVTGHLCDRPCEDCCYRGRKDGAVAVRGLERYVGDYGLARGLQFARPSTELARVAICGSGPAGLTAAYHLARRGYRVTVYDAAGAPGGMMRAAPPGVLNAEILRILDLGVELRCDCSEPTAEDAIGFSAVMTTVGQENSSLAESILHGMKEAEMLDVRLRTTAAAKSTPRPAIGPEKIKLDWYTSAPRMESAGSPTPEAIVAESKRCMSCGTCMACGNCWMYCSHGGFEKLPAGRRYRMKLDSCDGCQKCADSCPSGFIDMH